MSAKTNHNKGKFSSRKLNEINPEVALTRISRSAVDDKQNTVIQVSLSEEISQPTEIEPDLERSQELTEATAQHKNAKKPRFWVVRSKTAAIFAANVVMLPILAVGSITYYFGSQTIDKQIVLTRRENNVGLAEEQLTRERQLLAILLIGTGTTALFSGAVAAWGTRKLCRRIATLTSKTAKRDTEKPKLVRLNQSALQQNILQEVVAEARTYLKCDRVVVYSLDRDRYGVIVAESVGTGYTSALGKKIEDPYFEDKYRNGRVRAIDDVNRAEITSGYLAQLGQLEVKANLVTPIINNDDLFGLLVVHQCQAPRQWQPAEIEYLKQLAGKTGLALSNLRLQEEADRLHDRSVKESRLTQCFTTAVQHIRQSVGRDEVLEISVEEVKRILQCDRVVVYSLLEQPGVVVAESVAPGYPRTLQEKLEDPFVARYLDEYRNGKARAIDNIAEAGIEEPDLEQLAALEVKADLLTPLFQEEKLSGLLVAHQCQAPRHWQDYEIRWITQIATQVGFALDNARVLAESRIQREHSATESKWTLYFTAAVQHIRQSVDRDEVLEISVEEVKRILHCDRVVVYSLLERPGVVVAESVAPGYPRTLQKKLEDPFIARYLDEYRDGKAKAIDNISEAGIEEPDLEQLSAWEVKANLLVPLFNEGKLCGLLVAHQCQAPRHWEEHEIRWITQIAVQIGLAVDNVLLQKSNRRSSHDSIQSLNNFSLGINGKVDRAELITVAVEQARKLMKFDRVAVCQFEADGQSKIVAESVLSNYPQAIEVQNPNIYFARQDEYQYRQGQTEAIAKIEQADLPEPALKQLQSLRVKSSLVTPIFLQSDRLYGWLIAHQCQQHRFWSQLDRDLFIQLGLQLGFALDRVELQELEIGRETNEIANWESKQPQSDLKTNAIADEILSERSTELAQLPQAKISEITLSSPNSYSKPELITGEAIESFESAPDPILRERFAGEISDLSERISQQSSSVTESFQKLAALAKQLSENEKS